MGIRAHDLQEEFTGNGRPGEGRQGNVVLCTLERITEAPFEVYLLLRKSDRAGEEGEQVENRQPIWWKMSKKEWNERKEKVPDRIYFPPEHLILLSDTKSLSHWNGMP